MTSSRNGTLFESPYLFFYRNDKLDGPSGEKQTTTYQFTVKQPVADPGFKALTLKHW